MALMFFIICIVNFVDLLVVAARKEMCLTSEIKNRDLEFVKASHDIRASLAGITGMVEMSINDLPQGSELAKNLKIVKSRSLHLFVFHYCYPLWLCSSCTRLYIYRHTYTFDSHELLFVYMHT